MNLKTPFLRKKRFGVFFQLMPIDQNTGSSEQGKYAWDFDFDIKSLLCGGLSHIDDSKVGL